MPLHITTKPVGAIPAGTVVPDAPSWPDYDGAIRRGELLPLSDQALDALAAELAPRLGKLLNKKK